MALPYTEGKWVADAAVVDYCAMFRDCVLSFQSPDPSLARLQSRAPDPAAARAWQLAEECGDATPCSCSPCLLEEVTLAGHNMGGVSP